LATDVDKTMMKSIGVKMMLARSNSQMTREELAEKSGVEANSIYRYETGKQIPNFSTVIRISKALCVSIVDLVPDDYITTSEEDPQNILTWFYQMDKQDQQAMLRQMMALVMMKKAC